MLRQHYWLEKFPCLVWRHSIRTNSHKSTQTWTGIITSSLKPEQVLLHQASNLNRYYYIKPQTWTGIITSSIKPEQVLLHQASNLNRYYYIKHQTWTGMVTSSIKPEQVWLHQASNLNRYCYIKDQGPRKYINEIETQSKVWKCLLSKIELFQLPTIIANISEYRSFPFSAFKHSFFLCNE